VRCAFVKYFPGQLPPPIKGWLDDEPCKDCIFSPISLHIIQNRIIIQYQFDIHRQIHRDLMMKYKIVLNKTDEGYSVSCPGLPGCWSQGKTEAEALENIKDAIEEYLAAVYNSVKHSDVREVEIAV